MWPIVSAVFGSIVGRGLLSIGCTYRPQSALGHFLAEEEQQEQQEREHTNSLTAAPAVTCAADNRFQPNFHRMSVPRCPKFVPSLVEIG